MNIQLCENGHHYDQSKYAQCPYCNPTFAEVNRTVPLDQSSGSFDAGFDGGFGGDMGDIGKTVPLDSKDEVTVPIITKDKDGKTFDPVVGWLVCIEGPDKGKDYRILKGNSSIGRGATAQIRILGDSSISKEDAANISYIAKSRKFSLMAGETRNQIEINDDVVLPHERRELKAYDRILIGSSVLMFIPFCGGEFAWE
ncbi:MAG: hypothetical protein VB061_10330 [Christensenella sp.]|nr:hypothetical protein [Christensenella sp.]